MFKKLFGKKNDGFYLQLEDDKNTPKPAAKANKAKSAPPASTAKPASVVAPVATTQSAPVAASAAPAEQEAKKSVKKSAKQAQPDRKVAETEAPVIAPVVAFPAIKNFATDFLIKPSSDSSRRRPGANMNAYLDMARQATKPEAFKK